MAHHCTKLSSRINKIAKNNPTCGAESFTHYFWSGPAKKTSAHNKITENKITQGGVAEQAASLPAHKLPRTRPNSARWPDQLGALNLIEWSGAFCGGTKPLKHGW
jgi:hypothetical protein